LILHLNRVFWIDASGVYALCQFIERCLARGIVPILVHDSEAVRAIFARTGVLDHLGKGFVARDLHDALTSAGNLLASNLCRQGDCAHAEEGASPCMCLAHFCPSPPHEGNA